MSLNLLDYEESTGSAYINYKAGSGVFESDKTPFEFKQAVFDLNEMRTGWLNIKKGQKPDFVVDAAIGQRAERPTEEHRRGFEIKVYSKGMFGQENPVRTWSANSMGANKGISALYAEWESKKEPGKLPVVEFTGTRAEANGATHVPLFKIVKMVDIPQELSNSAPVASPSETAQEVATITDNEF